MRNIMRFLILMTILSLFACSFQTETGVSAQSSQNNTPMPPPTATPPPPPKVSYTPLPPDTVSPIIIQRLPPPGAELPPDGLIELVFDRAMDQAAVAEAFTLQTAAEPRQAIAGEISWPDERTMQFSPTQPLKRNTLYDAILTQEAQAADDAPLAEPFTFRLKTAGYLEVSQVIPADGTADVETDASITVIFNRPVVPLTSLEEAKDLPDPLLFEPAIEGSGEWLNTSIYLFTPAEDMPGGVAFRATVKAGLTDAAGHTVLPNDFAWQFTTQPPEVTFTNPPDGQTLVPIETPIKVTFNQPVDPESAAANFSLNPTGLLGRRVNGDFHIEENSLTFTPTNRLAFDTTYKATIEAGVTSTAGGEGMAAPYAFQFTTVPLPKITGTRPEDGDQNTPPYGDFRILFNTPINPATVMEHVEMTPPLPVTPTLVYTYYSDWDNSFVIGYPAQPSTDYEVRISPGIEDPYGNQTQEQLTVRFRTQPLPPNYQLRSPDIVGTYDAGLPAKLIATYVNIRQINLRLYQLDPAEITSRFSWQWHEYEPKPDTLIRQWQERPESPPNEQSFVVIDLVEGDGSLEPGLYYLESDSPSIPSDRGPYGRNLLLVVSESSLTLKAGHQDALVWATGLAEGEPLPGLTVGFYDEDNNHLGEAVTDEEGVARLELNRSGHRQPIKAVVLPDGSGQGFSVVSENWSRGISPYEFGLEVTRELPAYNAHIYTDRPIYRPGQTVAFKGLVRAENDVNFRLPDLGQIHLTVRDAAYETILDEMVQLSPSGAFNGEITLEEGAALGDYFIAVEFEGQNFQHRFQVAAYRPPEFEVTVESDRRELLRGQDVTATIQASYFFGGPLAEADVQWAVLAESYRFEPRQLGNYRFTDADDPYTCFHCWWWRQESPPQPIMEGRGATDANGQLLIELAGTEIDEALASGSHRLIIEATITGPDNQTISGRQSLVMHKGEYYIGLSPQEYVADAGEETAINLVAVDWAVDRLADKKLDVQIVRYEWVNTFVERGSGGYWDYQVQKELIDRFTVTTDNQGEAVARFTPPEGGSYRVIVQDAASLSEPEGEGVENLPRADIRSSIFIWVAGEEHVSWRRENHDRITLISDKAEYAPGETAEILIPSPFEGEQMALVTIERGRILEHEVIRMSGSSHIYRLPITEQHAPNIYLSVVLVQGREAPRADEDIPQVAGYKVGILPLDVTLTRRKLNIELIPSVEQAQPGQDVTYNLTVTDGEGQPVAAEFSLDLVDKAILTLKPRQPEAIVDTFYHRRGLGIQTASALSLSINRLLLELAEDLEIEADQFADRSRVDEEMVFDGGGGGMDEGMAMATAPALEMAEEAEAPAEPSAQIPAGVEVREEFSDTAYWNPILITDEQGRAQVTVTLPDNLTTWVMRGVGATTDTEVGEETVELVSTKPLLIRPVTPRFFVVDDRAEVAANINNNTDESLAVETTLATEGVQIDPQTPPVQMVTVPARSEAKVTWQLSVQDVEQAELVFAAESGQYSDAAKPRLTTGPEGTLLVYRYTAPDIVGTGGQLVEGGSRTEVIALPPRYDERRGELTVQLDPSLAAGMRDGLDYLTHFEYECTEQTVSRFLPNVLTFNALQELGIENEELAQRLPGLVEEGLNKLYTQQNSDGGWGWWAANESNVHLTAYVVFALTKAQQAGVEISDTVLASGQNYLLNHLQSVRQLDSTVEANRQAFVIYALAEGGRAPHNRLNALLDAREKLSHYARAYLALALSLTDAQTYAGDIDTLLSDINNAAILSATGAHWEEANYDWWAMNTDTRSTAIILDALARLDPQNELIPNVVRWLMVARQDGIWETTQETAWALIALTDWMVETGELDAAYDYSLYLNDEEQAEGSVSRANVQESIRLQVAVADLVAETGNLLTVVRTDGNGRLYYTAHLKVYLPVEEIEAIDRGIIVKRRYTLQSCLEEQAADETVVCSDAREAKLGDVIRVDLTIIAPNDLYYVVVEDPLPAGAEAIDTGLATTSLLAMDPSLRRTSRISQFDEGAFYEPYFWWWRWYSRSELRDEKVVLFADYLPKGTYEYSYTMRATLPGDYHVIPTLATEFYFPEVFGRGEGRLLSIGR